MIIKILSYNLKLEAALQYVLYKILKHLEAISKAAYSYNHVKA